MANDNTAPSAVPESTRQVTVQGPVALHLDGQTEIHDSAMSFVYRSWLADAAAMKPLDLAAVFAWIGIGLLTGVGVSLLAGHLVVRAARWMLGDA